MRFSVQPLFTRPTLFLTQIFLVGILTVSGADTLTLKDGTVMKGKFLGSDGKTIRFEGNIGQLTVEKSKVASIAFVDQVPTATAPAAAPAPAAQLAAEAEPETVTLPANTLMLVRMMSSVSSKSKPGSPFTAVLVYDLKAGDQVAAKAGTRIIGRVQSASEPRGLRGKSTLDIRLTEMILGSDKVALASSGYRASGDKGVKQAARGAAAGAAIGGIADGGDGAAKGAAAGAAVGVLKKGNSISIPQGTLLEFSLLRPATIKLSEAK